MERPHNNLESYDGAFMSFVDFCNSGLTDLEVLMNIIFFLDKEQSISQHFHLTGIAVLTGNLKDNLHLSFS